MKEKKLTIKYIVNEQLYGRPGAENEKKVYLSITYNRKTNNVKSLALDYADKEDLERLANSPEAIREVEQIRQVLALETNNFTEDTDIKGLKDKLRFYLKPIDEVYKEYGIKLMSGILVNGKKWMTAEEQATLDELREYLPFTKYLTEKGEYYKKTRKKPHVFIYMVYGFLVNQRLKPEHETLRELLDSIQHYLGGYNCLVDFLHSGYVNNKGENSMMNWLLHDLGDKFRAYLEDCKRAANSYSEKSIEEIEIGFLHSDYYRDIIKKNKTLGKL